MIIRTLDDLESLRDEWNALSASAGSPLLDHEWFACAARAFHCETDLRVVCVREGGVLAGVAPLVIDRQRGRRLSIIGAAALYEPSGWIYASESALGKLAREVVRLGQPLVLQRLPAGSTLCSSLGPLLAGRAYTTGRDMPVSHVVNTRGSWAEYQARLSSRTARKLRALRDRAEAGAGRWAWSMIAPVGDEAEGLLATLIQVEASGWKGRTGSALTGRQDLRTFFEGYSRRAANRRRLRVSVLRFGASVAAMELGVEAYGRHWGLKLAYDERFAAFAPALQLVHASIESTFDRGLDAYEFLGTAEPWQERWKPEGQPYRLLAAYPFNARGLLGVVADATAVAKRRARWAAIPGAETA